MIEIEKLYQKLVKWIDKRNEKRVWGGLFKCYLKLENFGDVIYGCPFRSKRRYQNWQTVSPN